MIKIALLKSIKPDEHRLPIHPNDIAKLSSIKNTNVVFQEGYGGAFGINDSVIARKGYQTESRDSLLRSSDIIVVLKPQMSDFLTVRENTTIIGWCHCVQDQKLTTIAVERKLTLIALEDMFYWRNGQCQEHVFSENNEIAGEMGVLHALEHDNILPRFMRNNKACVIGYGSVGMASARVLSGLGASVTVYSRRDVEELTPKLGAVDYRKICRDDEGRVYTDKGCLINRELCDYQVIVNAIKQDVLVPWMFLSNEDLRLLHDNALIVDVSCDDHMGFDFAESTTYEQPIRIIGGVSYYSISNIPSIVWKTSTVVMSTKLLPLLNKLLNDSADKGVLSAIESDEMLRHALQVKDGVIENQLITEYRNLLLKMAETKPQLSSKHVFADAPNR